ncbi:MAG TPA: riboflavin synthase [Chitinophagales bacterium]|nr:riboflavin synthase [Chitinophagales bacterium]HRK25844.1 riboflavin synthase [Chitinophagales bacterium]
MFTGIIETIGTVANIIQEGSNLHFYLKSTLSAELKIDQSVSHNGVCLTVVEVQPQNNLHKVTAIQETLHKTGLGQLKIGSAVNLERCMRADARIDGHFVQGHVDQTAQCTQITETGGSWYVTFDYEPLTDNILVNKGSICVDGVSLTVVQASHTQFTVAIIPYTYEHTIFHTYQAGTVVNLEFDIIGKYLTALFKKYAAAYLPNG